MKKNKLVYVLGALLSMGVVSCDLTEKPTSFYEMDTYFTTADKAKMAVIGIYDCLAAEGSYGQYVMPFASSYFPLCSYFFQYLGCFRLELYL